MDNPKFVCLKSKNKYQLINLNKITVANKQADGRIFVYFHEEDRVECEGEMAEELWRILESLSITLTETSAD